MKTTVKVVAGVVMGTEDALVVLPPLAGTFALPTREQLLALQRGDSVKLQFEHPDVGGERMWVILKEQVSEHEWVGVLENTPLLLDIPSNVRVRFHPLAVIDTMTRAQWKQVAALQEKQQQANGLQQPNDEELVQENRNVPRMKRLVQEAQQLNGHTD